MKISNPSKISIPKWATYHPYCTPLTQPATSNITSSDIPFTSERRRGATKSTTANKPSSKVDVIQNGHKIQTENEEFLLRTKAYHFTCTEIVQRSFDYILRHHLKSNVLLPLCHFMNQFQPGYVFDENESATGNANANVNRSASGSAGIIDKGHENNNATNISPSKRRKLETTTPLETLKQQLQNQMLQNKNYHPTLLPIGIINVQPSILDRHIIVDSLKSELMTSIQNQTTENRDEIMYTPTVCLLSEMESGSDDIGNYARNGNGRTSRVEHYLFTILRQVCFYMKMICTLFIRVFSIVFGIV